MAIVWEYPHTDFHEINLDWLLNKMQELIALVNTFEDRIKYLEECCEEVQKILEEINQKINEILDAIAAIEENIDEIEEDIEGIKDDIDGIKADIVEIKGQIADIDDEIDLLKAKDAAQQIEIDALQSSVQTLETKVDGLVTSLGDLQSTVAGHTTQIATHTTQINTISGKVDTLEETVKDKVSYDDNSVLGAHNLLKVSGSDIVNNGVTYTFVYDDNGNLEYVNANGTATANSYCTIGTVDELSDVTGYTIQGSPSNGAFTKWMLLLSTTPSGQWVVTEYGDGATIPESSGKGVVSAFIANNITADNLKFYPMIKLANDTAGYAPYAMTNLELTNKAWKADTSIGELWDAVNAGGGDGEKRLWNDYTEFWSEFSAGNAALGLHMVSLNGTVSAYAVSDSTSGAFWISNDSSLALYPIPIDGMVTVSQYMIGGGTSGVAFQRACESQNSRIVTVIIDRTVNLSSNISITFYKNIMSKRGAGFQIDTGNYKIFCNAYNTTFNNVRFNNSVESSDNSYIISNGTGNLFFENCYFAIGNDIVHTTSGNNGGSIAFSECSGTCSSIIKIGGEGVVSNAVLPYLKIIDCEFTCTKDAIINSVTQSNAGALIYSFINSSRFYVQANCSLFKFRKTIIQDLVVSDCYIRATHLINCYRSSSDTGNEGACQVGVSFNNNTIYTSGTLIQASSQGVFRALYVNINNNTISGLGYLLYDAYTATEDPAGRIVHFTNNKITSVYETGGIQFVRDNTPIDLLDFSDNTCTNIGSEVASGLWFTGTATKLIVNGNYIEGRPELQQGVGTKTVWSSTAQTYNAGTLYTFTSGDWINLVKSVIINCRITGTGTDNYQTEIIKVAGSFVRKNVFTLATSGTNVGYNSRNFSVDDTSVVCTGNTRQIQGSSTGTANGYNVPVSIILKY